ncbi:MAG TPA: DUF1294 domain-containing protein [Ruminococcaceae bacterium]|nr:DUF1294 domain-containing protein [Oscillospiraceae bacterium]
MLKYLLIYLAAINLYSFCACGFDKLLAVKKRSRISEKTLLTLSLMGGSAGMYGGMYFFRHKTLHKKFTVGIPLIIFLQILLVFMLFKLDIL